ncbi:hypothetical protein DNTS_022245 [Danionella cerebrum]|uniref:Rab effector MyRIP/Melanophilin domain-containing protein n=1 Tax=Danionella cerebrum TaxID=2873325 RepID=A0A553NHC9_9TELE|nr:hypothetical protein DNTS_022245 [Danionella translucida]
MTDVFVSLSTGASSVLQSPDGNWIALQSSQHSRPSLLTKRKSLVFSVLEKESGVVSAYDEMGLDSDPEDQGGWGAALLQFRRRLSDETYYTDSQHDPEWTYTKHPPVTSPSSGQYTETLNSDSDTSPAQSFQAHKPQHSTPQRKQVPFETQLFPPCRRPPGSASGLLDVNFNPRLTGDSSDGEDHSKRVKRSRRRRKSKHETSEPRQTHPSPYSTATMENSVILLNAMMMRRQQSQETPVPLNYQTPDTLSPHDLLTSDAMSSEAEPPEMSKLEFSKPELCLQGPFLKVSAVHEALREDLKFKVCDLVGEDHEKDARSNYFEEISEAGIKREDRTRRIESEKLRFKKRHESKTEIKSKGERQTVEQMDTSNVTRQINMEREIYRERDRQKEIEKQLERERERQRELENQIKSDREKQCKIEIQVERKRERQKEIQKQLIEEQERQLEIEREIEKKRKSIRIEKENIVRAKSKEDKEKLRREQVEASGRVLGDNTRLDEDGSETQKEKAEMISSEKEGEKTKTSMTSPTRAFCALEKSTSSSETSV